MIEMEHAKDVLDQGTPRACLPPAPAFGPARCRPRSAPCSSAAPAPRIPAPSTACMQQLRAGGPPCLRPGAGAVLRAGVHTLHVHARPSTHIHTRTHTHTHTHTHTLAHSHTHTLAHSHTPGLLLRSKASEAEAARACADMSEASEAAKQLRQRTHVVLAGLPAGSGATATAAASCGAAAAAGPAASGSGDGALGGGGAARKAMLEDEQRVLGQACSAHAADRLRQVRALRGLPRPARSVLPAPRYLRAHSGSTT